MQIIKIIIVLIVATTFASCKNNYPGIPSEYHTILDSSLVKADTNKGQILLALESAPKEQKEGMAFLISYMPKRDLTSLSAEFLLENVSYAYKAREEFAWCKALPDSIFFNEVLPYANITEDRDPWRKDFYGRFSKYAKDCNNMVDAIFAINNNIMEEVGVEYNVKRSRVDISPFQAIKENMATCTGLSILLTDAFRAVGIPSRLAGTAMWTNMKGNHTWSEVWIDGEWMFTEYYPDTLNKSWFVADAGKADPNNKVHWIYAVSYKPTELYFPAGRQTFALLEDLDESQIPEKWVKIYNKLKEEGKLNFEKYIYGVNVTQRYLDLYRKSLDYLKLAEDETMASIVVFRDENSKTSDMRLSCKVEVYTGDKKVDFGYSPSRIDDNNHFLKFKLKKDTVYWLEISSDEYPGQTNSFEIKTNDEENIEFELTLF